MKTISTRFLKGALAMLLAVVMLFGTTITGFAAVVDNVQANASKDIAEIKASIPSGSGNLILFNNTINWTSVHLYTKSSSLWNGNNGCGTKGATHYTMTRISGTNYWYAYMSTSYKEVVFVKDRQDNYDNLWETQASYNPQYTTSKPCFTPNTTSNETRNNTKYYSNGSWGAKPVFAPDPPKSVKIEVLNAYRGSGTQADPYIVEPGKTINTKITCEGPSTSYTGFLYNVNYTTSWAKGASGESVFYYDGLTPLAEDVDGEYTPYAWTYNDNETNKSTMTTGTKIYIKGGYNTHTVKFNDYNDTNIKTISDVTHNSSVVSQAPEANRTGYTFAGWKSNLDGKTYNTSELPSVTSDVTYTAQYNINKYSVSLETAGDGLGTAEVTYGTTTSSSKVENVEHFDTVTLKAEPVDQGVSVVWSIKNGEGTFTGDVNGNEVTFAPTYNTTILATFTRNQYKATFEYLDASGADKTDEFFVEPGGALNPPTVPTRTGYNFDGWSPAVPSTISEHDITYTAQYSLIPYTITLNLDGGTVESFDGNYNIETPTFTLPKPTKEGYRFLGWSIGDGDPVENVTIAKGSYGDKTYTAEYIKLVTLTIIEHDNDTVGVDYYTINGERADLGTYTFDIDTKITLKAVPKDGYRLLGFRGNGIDDTAGDTREITLNESITSIYAVASKLYTATHTMYTNQYHLGPTNAYYGGTVTITNATSIVGEDVTYTAEPYSNYVFYGWFDGTDFETAELVSTDPTYTVKQVKDGAYLVAMFYKYFKITGSYSGEFVYQFDSNTYLFTSQTYGNSTTGFSIEDANSNDCIETVDTVIGGTIGGHWTSRTFKLNEDYEAPIEFTLTSTDGGATYKLNVKATEINKMKVNITVDGVAQESQEFSADSIALVKFDIPDTKYIDNVQITATNGDSISAEKVGYDQIKFRMPAVANKTETYEVNISVTTGDLYSVNITPSNILTSDSLGKYRPGEAVTIKLTPNAGVDINGVTSADATVTFNDSKDTVTFTMPASNVTLTVSYEASYAVNCTVVCKDMFGDEEAAKQYCNVGVSGVDVNGYASYGATVTLNATSTQTPAQGYTFYGYYTDEECTKVRDKNAKLVLDNVTSEVNLYALFVRDVYIVGNVANGWNNFVPMTYNTTDNTYTYDVDVISGDFILTTSTTSSDAGYKTVWNNTAKGTNTGITLTKANDQATLSAIQSDYTVPIKLTLKEKATNSYTLDAVASKVNATVYLSSGRKDYDQGGSGAFSVSSQYLGYEGKYTIGTLTNATNEDYTPAYVSVPEGGSQFITVQTNIAGSRANLYDVKYYLIYDIATGKTSKVDGKRTGIGVFNSDPIAITGDTYVCPIFFANSNYEAQAGDFEAIEIYVDPNDIWNDATAKNNINWGPFISCYPYGKSSTENGDYAMTGIWPGQLMVPMDDGTFYTRVVFAEGETVSGIVFNNYMTDNTVPVKESSAFNLSSTPFVQTYDYREPVYLTREKYNVITYVPKYATQYHGDKQNNGGAGTYNVTSTGGIGAAFSSLVFTDLMNRDKSQFMDLTGKDIENGADKAVDFYVVAKGDVTVGREYNAADDAYDTNYTGQWCVEWYIYTPNAAGTGLVYKTKVLSGHMYNGIDTNNAGSQLERALETAGITDVEGKRVQIAYEAKNKTNQDRIDGQWYGNKVDDTFDLSVVVGTYDETNGIVVKTEPELNVADYGSASIATSTGGVQSTKLTFTNNEATITAIPQYNETHKYRFKGWYTLNSATGKYEPNTNLGTSSTITSKFGNSTVLYAIFEEIGEGMLTVTHQKYFNKTIEGIISRDGTGVRKVTVTDLGDLSRSTYTASDRDSAQVYVPVEEGKTYRVDLEVEPLGNDTFYAWYMDAFDADKNPTFEEVFTDGSKVDSHDPVTASFTFTYTKDMQTSITIYSDLNNISDNARLYYKYTNRFGDTLTITKNIKLTDDEITGYPGNGNQPMVPSFKEYTVLENAEDGQRVIAYTEEEINDYVEKGYEPVAATNRLTVEAPRAEVTETFGQDITWNIVEDKYEVKMSEATIYSTQKPAQFVVTVLLADGKTQVLEREYNSLLKDEVTADTINSEGEKFSYWQDVETGEILSYSRYYNYRVLSTRTIKAVYGETVDKWYPAIESVTYTREYSDASDYVYSDFLFAFHNSDYEEIDDYRGKEGFKYGFIMLRDPSYKYAGEEGGPNYLVDDTTSDELKEQFKQAAITAAKGSGNQKVAVNGKDYNAHYYDLTNKTTTTNLNRTSYYIRFKNTEANRGYAFTVYSYIIDGDEVYISSPKNMNIYEEGMKPQYSETT